MFCPNCQTQNEDNARFCAGCGLNLESTVENTTPPAYQPPPQAPGELYVMGTNPGTNNPVYPQYASSLNYEIFGGNLPAVAIKLNAGESIYTQSGGLTWMDEGMLMETNMKGGLMKGLGRVFSGESLFIATYTATRPGQEIVIASNFPGNIAPVDLTNGPIIAQKSAFLCAQPTVNLSAYVTKSIGSGFFGGEGFILQKMEGSGMVFLEIDGSLVEKVLAPGQKIKINTGNVAAFTESVQYQAEMVKGFKNVLFGGEGLFLTTLTGPGKVWLQTMTLAGYASKLVPYLPKSSS